MSADKSHHGGPGGRPRRPDWRVGAAAVVAILVLAALLVRSIETRSHYADLIRAEPDGIIHNRELAKFALDQAKPLFDAKCAVCHRADLKGSRATGVPDLTDRDWLYGAGRIAELEKTILYGIRSGHPRSWNLADMPGFGEAKPYRRYKINPLSPQDIRDVIAYMRLLEGRKPSDTLAAARGAKIYADTGQCFDCHADDGQGDSAIGAPNLTDDIWLYGDGSDQSLFQSIAHGHQGVMPAWSGRLSPGQVRALAVYVYAASHPATPAETHAAAGPPKKEGKPS